MDRAVQRAAVMPQRTRRWAPAPGSSGGVVFRILPFKAGQAEAVDQLWNVFLALRAPFLGFPFDGGAGLWGVLKKIRVSKQVAEQMGHDRLLLQDCPSITANQGDATLSGPSATP